MFAFKTITNKITARTIDSNTFMMLQIPIRSLVTLFTAYGRMKSGSIMSVQSMTSYFGDLNLFGFIFTILAGTTGVLGGYFTNDALEEGGSASAVAVITGCNSALSYVLSVIFGMETIHPIKVLGVLLAVASCCCFAIAK